MSRGDREACREVSAAGSKLLLAAAWLVDRGADCASRSWAFWVLSASTPYHSLSG